MPVITHCIVFLGVLCSLILGGYWLAVRLDDHSPAERLATSILTGLLLFIWNVSILGFFFPISGPAVWVCLWPIAATVLNRRVRVAIRSDLGAIIADHKGVVAIFSSAFFISILLWPLLAHPHMVFFDGTSNHDAFFWISGAEFLHDHTYMVEPVKSVFKPLTNGVGVFTGGWTPMWGRMSAEGLVALVSGIAGIPTMHVYVATTAALFLPWVAAVYLVAKTFLVRKFSVFALIGLCATQPLFVFFHANANLPNLLGCLSGAILVIAITRGLNGTAKFGTWHIITAISLHGLLCSYPEMAPFILLTVGLIWCRSLLSTQSHRLAWLAAAAGFAGLVLNPATTVRAFSGFYRSFHAASVDTIWPKLFENLSPADHIPALATLTLHTVDDAGVWIAGLCSVGVIAAVILVLRSASDRFGAAATLAGPALLSAYTMATHFSYGWQKVAQFGGVFVAAIIPVAAINLAATFPAKRRYSPVASAVLAGIMIFFTYATARNVYESRKWSGRKFIGDDWLATRAYSQQHLQNATVRVDAPSFSAPYFYGMWSLYALADSHPLFSQRESDNGGYVHDYTRNERNYPEEVPSAYFVSSRWAESFDANSPRLLSGQTASLLSKSNRVDILDGFFPKSGVPESASSHLMIGLRPHSPGELQFLLAPRAAFATASVTWHMAITVEGGQIQHSQFSGPPPWHFNVPLVPPSLNKIEISCDDRSESGSFPYVITDLRVIDNIGK